MTEYTRDDMARAWQEAHDELCPLIREVCDRNHPNPYKAPPLPPEPPEGTIVVDSYGCVWHRGKDDGTDRHWLQSDIGSASWWWLNRRGPLRVAVPLTDEERELIAEALRDMYGRAVRTGYDGGDEESLLALADRIEGTQP